MNRVLVACTVLLVSITCVYAAWQPTGVSHPFKTGGFDTPMSFRRRNTWRVPGYFERIATSGNVAVLVEPQREREGDKVLYAGVAETAVYGVDVSSGNVTWKKVGFQKSQNVQGPFMGEGAAKNVMFVELDRLYAMDVQSGNILATFSDLHLSDMVALPSGHFVVCAVNDSNSRQSGLILMDHKLDVVRSVYPSQFRCESVVMRDNSTAVGLGRVVPLGVNNGNSPPNYQLFLWDIDTNALQRRGSYTKGDLGATPSTIHQASNTLLIRGGDQSRPLLAFDVSNGTNGTLLWSTEMKGVMYSTGSAPLVLVGDYALLHVTVPTGGNNRDGSLSLTGKILSFNVRTGDKRPDVVTGTVAMSLAWSASKKQLVASTDLALETYTVTDGVAAPFFKYPLTASTGQFIAFTEGGDFLGRPVAQTNVDGTLMNFYPVDGFTCGPNFDDVECLKCKSGFFLSASSCEQCPTTSPIVIAALIGLFFVASVVWSTRHPPKRHEAPEAVGKSTAIEVGKEGATEGLRILNQRQEEEDENEKQETTAKAKQQKHQHTPTDDFNIQPLMAVIQFLHFAQLVSLINRVVPRRFWPEVLLPALDITKYINLDIAEVGVGCELDLGVAGQQWLLMGIPVLFYALLIGAYLFVRWRGMEKKMQAQVMRVIVQSVRFGFLGACVRGMTAFQCQDDVDASRLASDPTVLCFSGEWFAFAIPSMLGLLVLCALPLAGYVHILIAWRDRADDPFVQQAFGFMFVDFRPPAAAFEGLVLLRKLQATLLVLLLEDYRGIVCITMFCTVILMTVGVAVVRPFRRRRRNVLEVVLGVCAATMYMLAALNGSTSSVENNTVVGLITMGSLLLAFVAAVVVAVLDVREARAEKDMSDTERLLLEEDDTLSVDMTKSPNTTAMGRVLIVAFVIWIAGQVVSWVALSVAMTRGIEQNDIPIVVPSVFANFSFLVAIAVTFVKEGRTADQNQSVRSLTYPMLVLYVLPTYMDSARLGYLFVTGPNVTGLIFMTILSQIMQVVWWVLLLKRWRM